MIEVVYEDNHLIALHKPAGWLVQEDESEDTPLVEWAKAYIKERYKKPGDVFLHPTHRLDRPVSGLVLFARTSKALARMSEIFHDRKIEKTYLAVVERRPQELQGHLEHYLVKDEAKNIVTAYNKPRYKTSKKAVLDYRLIGEIGNHYLLEVKPLTGRPHQIRVQLAKMGCPIRGDLKYGAKYPNADGRIHLHAYALSFVHPVKKEPTTIVVYPPNEQIWNLFRSALGDVQINLVPEEL
jgi:23S rRNA pseudouridine1911/1915/1917 synthase